MWIARNRDARYLKICRDKPKRNILCGYFYTEEPNATITISEEKLKLPFEVTWENSPIEIEIEIKRK